MCKYALVVLDFCPCIITNRAPGLRRKSLHSAKCAGRYREVAWRAAWKPSHSASVTIVRGEMPKFAGMDPEGIDFQCSHGGTGRNSSPSAHTVHAQDLATLLERCATVCACVHCAAAVHSDATFTAPFVVVTGPSLPQRPVRGLRGYPSHSSSPIQRDDHLTASFSCLVRRRSLRA